MGSGNSFNLHFSPFTANSTQILHTLPTTSFILPLHCPIFYSFTVLTNLFEVRAKWRKDSRYRNKSDMILLKIM